MKEKKEYILKCVQCEKEYYPEEVLYTCPDCGNRLGTLEVIYRFQKGTQWIREEFSGIWKFIDLLPVQEKHIPSQLAVGDTPLLRAPAIEKDFGIKEVWIKDDGKNPTASLKDRASIVAIAKAFEYGYKHLFAASTGNAASSLAGLCAPCGLKTHIYLPSTAPEAKIAQLLIYGAEVFSVDGSYDDAFDLSLKEGIKKGWYCRNSAINPYLLEGKKTATLELILQLKLNPPDILLVSVGDGTIYSSVHKAFHELVRLKVVERIPIIIGVQGEQSDSVKRAFEKGEPFSLSDLEVTNCLADSISVGKPRDVLKACKWAKLHAGFFLSVSDEEIGSAIIELARKTGVFAEPAGAVPYAGLKKLYKMGYLKETIRVALMVTGNGLKDVKAAIPYLSERITRIAKPVYKKE